jgi:hypothetical protein
MHFQGYGNAIMDDSTECVCRFCGMSFNLGRIRCPDELEDAAWCSYGGGFITVAAKDIPCVADGYSIGDRVDNLDPEEDEYEHLAGPNCTST